MDYEYKEVKMEGSFITADDSIFAADDSERKLKLCNPDYIWVPFFTRLHLFREVTLSGFDSVLLELECDNQLDLIINGECALQSYEKNGFYSDVIDVTQYFKSGKNTLALRLFQCSGFGFSAALRGSLAVISGDKREIIPFDKSFEFRITCNFGEGKEIEGWDTKSSWQNPWNDIKTASYRLHPRRLRRSLYLRRGFTVNKPVKSAKLYVTALGLCTPFLNGEKVTEDMFLPGAMQDAAEYLEYDVTSNLKNGKNILGFITGNGWYNCESWGSLFANRNAVAAALTVKYTDGTVQKIVTDESFSCALSPYVENDIQYGERYDSRLEKTNWCLEESGGNWVNAIVLEKHPSAVLHSYPPVRVCEILEPISVGKLSDGRDIFDFGVNTTGRCGLRIKQAKPGTQIEIGYCERLDDDGNPIEGVYGDVFYPCDTLPSGRSQTALRNRDVYICNGNKEEIYEPQFAYTGYRYIYIKNLPKGSGVVSRVMHTDLRVTGEVQSSNSGITKLWDIITRTFRNNILAGPTDCPTREKNFWNGDISAFAYTAMWYMDCRTFLGRWSDIGRKMERGTYGWEDEEYLLPLKLWKFYGDRGILKRKFPKILELIRRREAALTENLLVPNDSARYRDHLSIINVPEQFFGFAFHTYMYKCAAEIADVIEKPEFKTEFSEKYRIAKERFNREFYIDSDHDYTPKCQGGIILPLMLGIADEKNEPQLLKKLCEYAKNDGRLTTGFITTESLLMMLAKAGDIDTAVRFLLKEDYPSWLYLIKTGATTITETWQGHASREPMDSMDHYTFGSVGRFIFETLGGICCHTADFAEVTIKPYVSEIIGDLTVSYSLERGKIISSWKAEEGSACIKVTVPEATTATVILPNGEKHTVKNGKTAEFRLTL